MAILLVTGLLAKKIVEEQAKLCNKEVKVLVLDFPVASLLKPAYILRELRKQDLKGIECIMVPGLIRGDLSIIEEELKIKVVKGPKHAKDIAYFINNFDLKDFSKDKPADEMIKEKILKQVNNEVEKTISKTQSEEGNYILRNISYGKDCPIRIIAEIVDAPLLSKDELIKKAKYYLSSGADVIDIGMVAGQDNSDKIRAMIEELRKITDKPLSIDSMDLNEINEAIDAGIDMVISLDKSSISGVKVDENVHYVLVPVDLSRSYFPKEPNKRIEMLDEMIEEAKKRGIKNIIADAILDPPFSPSLYDSLVSYKLLREKRPFIPILIGAGNLTELIDADTPGMNSLIMMLAYELNASFILSTEVSDKCKGVIKELSIASKMGFIAREKRTYPKGLGIDLLILRDKKIKDEEKESEEGVEVIEAKINSEYYAHDPKGWFKIYLDREKREIILHYKKSYKDTKSSLIIKGKDPSSIYRKVAELGLISKIDHACYLGSELQKAYIALKLGKSYIQDSDLFENIYTV